MNLKGVTRNYSWQLAKAVTAFLTVILYSRLLGSQLRGGLSLYLLYLQFAMMINELVVGSVMANWFVQFEFKQLTRRLWWVSGFVLGIFAFLGFFVFHWGWVTLPLVALGATLIRQNMVINLFQSRDLIELRNQWQFRYEALKLLLLLISFGATYLIALSGNQLPEFVQNGFNDFFSALSNSNPMDAIYFLILSVLALAGLIWWWLSSPMVELVLATSDSVDTAKNSPLINNSANIEPPVSFTTLNSELTVDDFISKEPSASYTDVPLNSKVTTDNVAINQPASQEAKFGWAEIKDGVMAQLGHLILFLIYRMPIFMCSAWMLNIWGFNTEETFPSNQGYLDFTGLAGVLSNVLLIADSLWIFANSLGGMVHARLLQPEMLTRSEASQNRWIWRFFVLSIFGTAVLALITAVIPKSLYILIFGPDFGDMAVFLKIILPGILALGISAVLGHVLHARNQFINLLWNHTMGLVGMLLLWWILRKPHWPSEMNFAKYVLLGFNFALLIVMMLNFFSMGEDFRKRIKTPRNILITLQLLMRFIRNRTR